MDYIIQGGNRLNGEISVYGAKNCALPLLGASVLTEEDVVLHNCPRIVDVDNMLKLLSAMGKRVARYGDTVVISGRLSTTQAPQDIAKLLRGSALILGGTLGAYHTIDLPLPGGCAIGARPMDIHLLGLERMGVRCSNENSVLSCRGKPRGAEYTLRFASVGATENLVCAGALARGNTVLHNCAAEPEVETLERMLAAMGAKLEGIGTTNLSIEGVERLHGVEFDIIPDRIVAATYLSAVVASGGCVTVTNCNPEHMRAFLNVLEPRFTVKEYSDAVMLKCDAQPSDYGEISTAPYPLFPTDMQSLVLSMSSFADGGCSVIRENLFESRLSPIADELKLMGADIDVYENTAIVKGQRLHGSNVEAHDLRGGAALVVAGLNAMGTTTLAGVENICRGYLNLAENLSLLGADIKVNI